MTEAGRLNWPVPGEFPVLRSREIHLWCGWLTPAGGADPAGPGGLSPDEIARAGSFHFPVDRQRFVAARRNLRRVLAAYTDRDPATLVFSYGRFGKPMLIHQASVTKPLDPTVSNLAFNQSHCGPLWLLAVAWNQPVGVDVEQVKDLPEFDLIENRIFSPAELPQQQSLPAADRQREFFHRWTQREAAAKFQGLGFEPAAHFVPPDQGELLAPAEGYVGSLAYGGAPVRVQRFGWDARLLRPPGANPTGDPASSPQPAAASFN